MLSRLERISVGVCGSTYHLHDTCPASNSDEENERELRVEQFFLEDDFLRLDISEFHLEMSRE